MTARSDRWGSASRQPRQPVTSANQGIGRWGAHRMSRRFARVGVHIPAARLRAMTSGASLAPAESIDYTFAVAAIEIQHQQRLARSQRTRQRVVRALIVVGLMLAALNLLICLGYAFLMLVLHGSGM